MTIKELDPQIVWKNFYALTQIPRPSKHEELAAHRSTTCEPSSLDCSVVCVEQMGDGVPEPFLPSANYLLPSGPGQ